MRNCKYICLAGGLSMSSYFQHKMREEFGQKSKYKLALILPRRPILSVVEGAAYFGITPNYIKARVLGYTYGEIMDFTQSTARAQKVPEQYIKQYGYYDEENQIWKVEGCFKIMARKGQEIYTGQIVRSLGYRGSPSERNVDVTVAASQAKDPKVINDGWELGVIATKFPNNDEDDMCQILEFHFYETVIKAVVYREKDPNDKQQHYIINY